MPSLGTHNKLGVILFRQGQFHSSKTPAKAKNMVQNLDHGQRIGIVCHGS